MFGDSSRYYDLIYGFKDYRQEAEFLRILIERVAPGARTLLDVACGTGEHLRYLTGYQAEGLDLNSDSSTLRGASCLKCVFTWLTCATSNWERPTT